MHTLNRFFAAICFFLLFQVNMVNAAENANSEPSKPNIVASSLKLEKGVHINDTRYKGAYAHIDNTTYGFKGSDVISSVQFDINTDSVKIIKAIMNYGDVVHEATIDGNSLTDTCNIANTGKYGKIVANVTFEFLKEESAQPIESNFSFDLPGNIVLFEEPTLDYISAEPLKCNELESLNINYSAKANGAYDKGWEYTWLEGKDSIESGDKINKNITHDVSGDVMKTVEYTYNLAWTNIAPDDSTILFSDTTFVNKVTFYNSPKKAQRIETIKNGSNVTYAASGFNESDEDLHNKKYLFVFGEGEPQETRYVVNPEYAPVDVKTLWKYEDFDCYSETTLYTKTEVFEPEIKSAKAKFSKGSLYEDERYTGAVVTDDGITHALLGSELTYTVEIDTKGGTLISGAISYGELKQEAVVDGNKLTNTCVIETAGACSTITVDAVISMKVDESGQSVQSEMHFQVPRNNTFVLYDVPEMPVFEAAKLQSSELSSYTLNYTAKAKGAYQYGWYYEWIETNTDSIIATGAKIKKDISHSVSGDEMKIDEYDYYVRCYNIAPDQETVWFSDTIFVVKGAFYNSPKPATYIGCIKNGDDNVTYVASGFSETDRELAYKKYLFVFSDGEPQSSRYLVNPEYAPINVKTLWKYEDFDCYSEATMFDESAAVEPSISEVELTITKGLNEKDKQYKGAVKTKDGKMHALVGSDINYAITIDTQGGQLMSGTINFGEEKMEAVVDERTLSATYCVLEQTGKYDNISVDAVIRYFIEEGQARDVKMSFKVSKNNTFIIYPTPVYPVQVKGYSNQFAYSEERSDFQNLMDIKMSVVPGDGANKNWEYSWTTETAGVVSNDTILHDKIMCKKSVGGDVKKTDIDYIRLNYYDIAPDGSVWIEGYIDYPVKIYNVPSTPTSFKKKGNTNASVFYIASMDTNKFGTDGVDQLLKEREYFFEYGNADTTIIVKDSNDAHLRSRWCDYTNYDKNDPWVQTLWKYPSADGYPEFTAYSDRCYLNGVRSEITDIDSIKDEDSCIISIYDAKGNVMPMNDSRDLPSGIYIILKKEGDEVTRTKLIVR